MTTLNRANRELYRRGPDESFTTLQELHDHCRQERQYSSDVWQLPHTLQPQVALVDAMTRLTQQRLTYAADRAEADFKVAQLLSLALAASGAIPMDPQATWSQLQDACRDQDWDAADELAQSLLNWLARGGFAPVTSGGNPNDAAQQRELVIHFCESVLQRRTPNSFAN